MIKNTQEDNDPPPKSFRILIFSLAILGLVNLFILFDLERNSEKELAIKIVCEEEITEFTREPVLYSISSHAQIDHIVFSSLMDKIIQCESGGDPKACNHEFGCSGGMGLCGFITKTWNSTLDRMNCEGKFDVPSCQSAYLPKKCNAKISLPASLLKSEPIFDPYCNRLVGEWLLKKDGTCHWGDYSTWWGSWSCWK